MVDILRVLIQFVFRVTFGLSLAMGIVSPRQVTSGYYQKHLWVLMGLNTLASLAVFSSREAMAQDGTPPAWVLGGAIGLAVGCYVASVVWLYERPGAGRGLLGLIALGGWVAAFVATPGARTAARGSGLLTWLDTATGGLVLGTFLAAMFLGHWYLNHPGMPLAPLKRLIQLLLGAIMARALVAGLGVGLRISVAEVPLATEFWLFLSLRWLAGLVGTLAMAGMAWGTLKIPNTQSATGVLYAGVILAFIGELTSQLLSVGQSYPV